MISKRKREENESKRSSTSSKAESLPLESQELTYYHVVQLQESNKQHKRRINELEARISEMIPIFDKIQDEGKSEEENLSRKFEHIIKQKDDEILSLRNENQRLSMQNIFKRFYSPGNSSSNTNSIGISGKNNQSNGQGATLSEPINDCSSGIVRIDIISSDIKSKLIEKEKQISELTNKYEAISQENFELRKSLNKCASYESFGGEISNKKEDDDKICTCVQSIIGEIFELRTQLNSEKLKFVTLIESELFKGIKDFLSNQKSCEEHNKVIMQELEDIKCRYDSLKQNLFFLESYKKTLDARDKEQKKKIRELELANSKIESEKTRMADFIKTVSLKLEKGEKEGVIENLMNEYEELSNAFEEKSLECDNLRQKLKEKEKEYDDFKIGIDDIKQTLKEMETIKILYEEKLSLVRRTNKNEPPIEGLSSERLKPNQETRISEFLNKHLPLISKLSEDKQVDDCQTQLENDFNDVYKSLIEQKTITEKHKLDLEFYKSEYCKLKEKLKSIENKELNYNTTISILKNRVQYILNRVHKLTNLEINFDDTEENVHLQIDDYDKEINSLKSENQELLTLMKCSVCRDKVKDTVINRCGHIFCRDCIDRNLSSRNRKCPLCHINFDKNDTGRIFLY
ncbi:Zinc finger, C3HC4 type (RING finger) family protein [Cryptosporidium meleagridis]|uniref:E3 ubiquitin protein ligase n=1 Tax=Cryptosporidium meleagridis TaxID=93969 RepID=A0A2P4Z6I2_9CRYT|nr:Zinc finger, C3HC4 type (RING finger) family protein [Cryptosporidium meleagridis]